MTARPYLSVVMKRIVRQRCFFGCVFCGSSIIEYDHIEEFSVVREHSVDNLTALCPNHHAMKTKGLISADQVKRADANPYNRPLAFTQPFSLPEQSRFCVQLGANTIGFGPSSGDAIALWVDGQPLLTIHRQGGLASISATLSDKTGLPIAIIRRGEVIFSTGVWDALNEGSRFILRNGPGDIVLDFSLGQHLLEVNAGSFFTATGSGFQVCQGMVIPFSAGKELGAICRVSTIGGTGAWGLVTDPTVAEDDLPPGFALWLMPPAEPGSANLAVREP